MDLIGTQLGKYHIVERISTGGMAEVYKAYQPDLDRHVAIKIIASDLSGDPAWLAQFKREAQMLARLQHPNILPIYDYGDYNGMPYLVMQYNRGGTLADCLGHPQPVDDAVRIVSQIGDALAYAHAHGVVHRDVKPSNILLTESGRALLTDFGIAAPHNATNLGGTQGYMPPEQRAGKPVDGRADIFALGVILYEMLTGKSFAGQNYLTRSVAINRLPSHLIMVIAASANYNLNHRYQLAEDFVAALHDAYNKTSPKQVDAPTSAQTVLEIVVIVLFALAGLGIILYGTTLSNAGYRAVAIMLGFGCFPISAMFAFRDRSHAVTIKMINAVMWVTMGIAALVIPVQLLSDVGMITAGLLAELLLFALPGLLLLLWGARQYVSEQRRQRALPRSMPATTPRRTRASLPEIRQIRNAMINTVLILIGLYLLTVIVDRVAPHDSFLHGLSSLLSGGLIFSGLVLGLGLAVWYIFSLATSTASAAESQPQAMTTRIGVRRDRLGKARQYQAQIRTAIANTREGPLRDRLQRATAKLDEWIAYLERLTLRLDEFDRDPAIQRDRSTVPRAVDRLEARLNRDEDADENVQDAARQTLAARQMQLRYLNQLEQLMAQAEFRCEQTVAELGTVYSQALTIDAKDIEGIRARQVQVDIDEQVQELCDLLIAMDEVQRQHSAK